MSAEDVDLVRERMVSLGKMSGPVSVPDRYGGSMFFAHSVGPRTPLVSLGTEALYGAWVDLTSSIKPAIRTVLTEHETGFGALTAIRNTGASAEEIEANKAEVARKLRLITEQMDGTGWQEYYMSLKATVIRNSGRESLARIHEMNQFMGYAIMAESGLLQILEPPVEVEAGASEPAELLQASGQ